MLVIFYFWISELLFCINKIKWNEQYKLYNSINSIKKSMKRIFRYKYCIFQKKYYFLFLFILDKLAMKFRYKQVLKYFIFNKEKR